MIAPVAERQTVILPDGRSWLCPQPADALMLYREIFEEQVYADAASALRPGDTVLDVGAHTGLSALYFGTRVADVRVLAVEPATETFACLRANLAAHLPTASPEHTALGETVGTIDFVYYPQAPSQSGRYAEAEADDRLTLDYLLRGGLDPDQAAYLCAGLHVGRHESVPMRTVSALLAEHGIDRLALLKIDVERAEWDVLSGVAEADWPKLSTVVAEVHDVGGRLERCRRLLGAKGFAVSTRQEPWLAGSELYTVLARR